MRLWIGMTLLAIGLAAGTWWLTRETTPESTQSTQEAPAAKIESASQAAPPRRPIIQVRATEIEPVAVIPETDVVEAPREPAILPIELRETAEVLSPRLVPRPEAGIDPTLYMPYADEGTEVARLRRRQTEEPPLFRRIRDLEETAEPPLGVGTRLEPRRTGKLPCSMK